MLMTVYSQHSKEGSGTDESVDIENSSKRCISLYSKVSTLVEVVCLYDCIVNCRSSESGYYCKVIVLCREYLPLSVLSHSP